MKQPKNKKQQIKKQPKNVPLEINESDKWVKRFKWILFSLAFLLYANTLQNGYNMDDTLVTQNHPLTSQGIDAIGDIFTSPYYQDDMGYAYGYRPMVHLSFAIEHTLFGEKPDIGHLINTVLFAFSCLLLFKFLFRINKNELSTWIVVATLLFAVHPIHTEVVASLKNRDELLAFLFAIASGISMIAFFDKKKWLSLFWALLFFTAAMLSKKSALPMLFILSAGWVLLREVDFKRFAIFIAALSIPAILIAADMEMSKIIPLFVAVVLFLGFVFVFFVKKVKLNKQFFHSSYFMGVITLLLLGIAYYTSNPIVLILALIYFAYSYSKKPGFMLYVIPIALFGFYLVLDYEKWILLPIVLFSYYLIFNKHLTRGKLYFLISCGIITFVTYNIFTEDISAYIIVLLLAPLVVWLSKKYPKITLSFLIVELIIVIPILGIESIFVLLILMLPSSIILLSKYYSKIPDISVLLTVIALIMFIENINGYNLIQTLDTLKPTQSENIISEVMAKTQVYENTNFLKEGRALQPIENTLVLPHTKSETIATGFSTLGEYFRLMVYPAELSFYYGYAKTKTENLLSTWVWISIIIHTALLFIGIWFIRKKPIISFGILWYFGSILLFSNWIELVAGMVGERLAFGASAGFCILVGGVIATFSKNFNLRKPKTIEWSFIVVLCLLSFRTNSRNSEWKDTYTLMSHDIKHLENSAQANNLLASSAMTYSMENPDLSPDERIDLQRKAIAYFDKAIEVWPGFFNAAFDKGRAAMILRDTSLAITGFEKAVKIGNPNFLFPYYQLQDLYMQTKDYDKYLDINKQLIILDSLNPKIYGHLANSYFMLKNIDSAEIVLQDAVKKFPDENDLKLNLEKVKSIQNTR